MSIRLSFFFLIKNHSYVTLSVVCSFEALRRLVSILVFWRRDYNEDLNVDNFPLLPRALQLFLASLIQ